MYYWYSVKRLALVKTTPLWWAWRVRSAQDWLSCSVAPPHPVHTVNATNFMWLIDDVYLGTSYMSCITMAEWLYKTCYRILHFYLTSGDFTPCIYIRVSNKYIGIYKVKVLRMLKWTSERGVLFLGESLMYILPISIHHDHLPLMNKHTQSKSLNLKFLDGPRNLEIGRRLSKLLRMGVYLKQAVSSPTGLYCIGLLLCK